MQATIKIAAGDLKKLLAGFLWTCAGGLGPAAVYLWHSLHNWQGYFKADEFLELISSGAGPLALAYWYKHQQEVKALLQVPDDTQEELAALREIKEEYRRHLSASEGSGTAPLAQSAKAPKE